MKTRTKIMSGWAVLLLFAILGAVYIYRPAISPSTNVYHGPPGSTPYPDPDQYNFPNSAYSKRQGRIYYADRLVDRADASSFHTLSFNLGADGQYVFLMDYVQPSIDVGSFEKVGQFWHDKNGFYTDQGSGLVKLPFDPTKAKQLEADKEYWLTDDTVYFASEGALFKKIEGADPKTLHFIGECGRVEIYGANYVADDNHVYVGYAIVAAADPKTLKIIGTYEDTEGMPAMFSFSKDKDTAFVNCGEVIKDVDVATFEYIGNGKAQDKNNIYTPYEFGVRVTPR